MNEFSTINLNKIGLRYSNLRIVFPRAEQQMFRSLKKHGQISPVIVTTNGENLYELIDGFKRYRAGEKLGWNSLKTRIVKLGERANKAAMLQLNWTAKSVTEFEEALIVRSLYREDQLKQIEIAVLLERHKSWVSRRISLIERLGEEIQSEIQLGLVSISMGRELAKLPYGNQKESLDAIRKHRLTCREAEKLVASLLESHPSTHESILGCERILAERNPPALCNLAISQTGSVIKKRLGAMERGCASILEHVTLDSCAMLPTADYAVLSPGVERAIQTAELAVIHLRKALGPKQINPEEPPF